MSKDCDVCGRPNAVCVGFEECYERGWAREKARAERAEADLARAHIHIGDHPPHTLMALARAEAEAERDALATLCPECGQPMRRDRQTDADGIAVPVEVCACGFAMTGWEAATIRDLTRERDRLRAALEAIRNEGRVCGEFELCDHGACASSYASWALADAALRSAGVEANNA